jgi:1-acyl-sn-glycerol-3-phosphate acyltransferase
MTVGLGRWAENVSVATPGVPSKGGLCTIRHLLSPVVKLAHRPTLEGTEHLPDGPFLLVANHSGGLAVAEINTFAALWVERFADSKPIAGFAHPFGFVVWPTKFFHRHVGTIPSTYAAAAATLAAGVPILVFPGGDHEVTRPFWQANRVDFGGRRGFARVAHQGWVPVVPMGIHGSHLSAPVLFRTRILSYVFVWPRLVGQKRWPVMLLAVLVAGAILAFVDASLPVRLLLAWLWMACPVSLFPWVPTTIRMRIGAPISPETLFASPRVTDDTELNRARDRVEAAVQALVTLVTPPR